MRTCTRFLPPVYVLRSEHVRAVLERAPTTHYGTLILWIHSATLRIESGCFRELFGITNVNSSFKLVCTAPAAAAGDAPPPPRVVTAALLGALVSKIGAYEADLVDGIREFAKHIPDVGERHRVGDGAFTIDEQAFARHCANPIQEARGPIPKYFSSVKCLSFRLILM